MHSAPSALTVWQLSCLLALLFVFFPVTTAAQNVLEGKVIAPDGTQPTQPVRVRLTYNGRLILETFTDLSGRFTFPGIGRGTYQLTAEGDGRTFQTTSVSADVTVLGSAPQSFAQDIQLRPLPTKVITQPGVVNAFRQDVPAVALQAFNEGMKLVDTGKRDEAVEKFRHAVAAFPKYFDAHLQLGNLFLKSGRAADAIAELDLAREINPNDERTFQSFGLLMLNQKNYPVAVAVFAEAARLNPSNPVNALMRGTALIYQAASLNETNSADRTSLLHRAEEALGQALSLSDNKMKPDAPTLALFFEMKGEPQRAVAELESYLKKSPESKNAAALKSEIKRLREKAQAQTSRP